MYCKKLLLAAGLLSFSYLYSQHKESSIDTVYIFDNQLDKSEKVQVLTKLKEQDILKNTTNFSEILRFQSPVYIKENGRGAVSSPSFRGTTAQQTAVIWNGININSLFLGQADLNNIGYLTADELTIKSGGGSVIYGSSAIGGTLHLNNELNFNRGLKNTLFLEYGSYKTMNTFLKSSFSNENLSLKISGSFNKSENDYEVPEKRYINYNGQYENKSINIGIAYKLNPNNTIAWQTQFFDGSQHYPTSPLATKTKYLSDSFRSLVDWMFRSEKIKNSLKLAYLEDEFQYFQNINFPKSSGGTGKIYLAKNDFNYLISDQLGLNFISEYHRDQGSGYQSGIQSVSRNSASVAGLFRWKASGKMYLEAGAKKEFIENVDAPFLFSFSGKLTPTKWYSTVLNISKNFRNPSFNDLYWQPGGNPDLKPETSYQAELNNRFKFGDFKLNLTPYYIKIENMIQWIPGSAGYWSPVNTYRVESYGLESQLEYEKKFGKNQFNFSCGYIYTHSKNTETDKFLMYVPQHKIYGNATYRYGFAEILAQGMFNGRTFTTSDESRTAAIPHYFVLNAGLNFNIYKQHKIGFKVNNIFDEIYETTAYYPLPKRNYSINLLINL